MPTQLGTVYRGSAAYRILAELERYPDTWVRWYQLPAVDDLHKTTILQAIQRLIRTGQVDHRIVYDEDTKSTGKTRGRNLRYVEIHHRAEGDD